MKALDQLVAGDLPFIMVGRAEMPRNSILLPGSFNPLHQGHEGLLRAAEKVAQREGLLELSVSNVDKPPLDIPDIERRLLPLKGVYSVVLTRAPTFMEKAALFPGMWFALGYDTAVRLLSQQYHDDVPAMLRHFQAMDTHFVVAGRLHHGQFQEGADLNIPKGFDELFIPIPESLFREDISSSELRKKKLI